MRGIVFTLDATFALVLVMIFAGTLFAMLENFSQPDESLTLSRLARDVYEIRHYGATDTAAGRRKSYGRVIQPWERIHSSKRLVHVDACPRPGFMPKPWPPFS